MGMAYRRALFCGAFPLALGVSIFLLWVLTRWNGLMGFGLVTLFGGLAFFLGGVLELIRYFRLGLRAPDLSRRQLWLRTAACGALLLSNFPVAAGVVVAVDAVESCYAVEIRNDSGESLEDVRVTGAGCDVPLGTMRPGASMTRWLWAKRDGNFVLKIRGREAVPVSGYVCSGMGGRATVTVRPDGTVVVDER